VRDYNRKRLTRWAVSHGNVALVATFLPRCMQRGLATRKLSVCLSVCPSVWQTRDLWQTKETCADILTPNERSFIPVLWQEEVWWERFFYLKFGSEWPGLSENADFQSISARSASAVTLSKKVQLTLIGSPLRAFQWA